MNDNIALQPYLVRLRALPFVRRVKVDRELNTLAIESPQARHSFSYQLMRSHLSKSTVEAWVGRGKGAKPSLLVFAPYVSDAMSSRLRENGISYLDAVGNVSLSLNDGAGRPQHVALIEGRAPSRVKPAERAWRAESYQVLFTLLAAPTLLAATVREIATRADVSTSPVLQVRERLLQQGWAAAANKGLTWTPGAIPKARDYWLTGYHATLRPRLLIQRYRPREKLEAEELQDEISRRFDKKLSWRWGGAAAAWHVDPYYRTSTTVVHVDAPHLSSQEFTALLRMIPDSDGPIVLLRRPGPEAFSPSAIVHPLLVWAELLEEANDRASETATLFAARYLEEDADALP